MVAFKIDNTNVVFEVGYNFSIGKVNCWNCKIVTDFVYV